MARISGWLASVSASLSSHPIYDMPWSQIYNRFTITAILKALKSIPIPNLSHRTPKYASLLGLPLELRQQIYDLAIPSSGIVEIHKHECCIVSLRDTCIHEFVLLPPLCQTSRQLRHETISFWFGRNTFYIQFNKYHWNDGRWLKQVEPLWSEFRSLVLQLDSERVRARKEKGQVLQATLNLVDRGTLVTVEMNLPLGEKERMVIARTVKTAMGGEVVERLDGRALVAVVVWLLEHAHKGSLLANKDYKIMELDVGTLMAAG
ncbi:hypothetical protein CC80DRAFT_292180 [Byssothecium circinans]|uniref:2EXR domain-containing protein n=1 Tax=Byssothecium circinans TaxID=147558 RepID=A0A6A5U621_9PLEO|nr:hypothetical protein CC80DRAFT_292180 [Byssothecium circinans]